MQIKGDYIRIEWTLEDGYVGGTQRYATEVSIGDILECDTEADVSELIADVIQDDFEQKVSWCCNTELTSRNIINHISPDGWAHRPEEYTGGDGKIV